MKVGIVGSREFRSESLVRRFVQRLHHKFGSKLTIVSGGARGPDSWAESEADDLGIPTLIFHPVGRAYKARNSQIVDASDVIIAFWDGVSGGTKDTILKARGYGKKLLIVK